MSVLTPCPNCGHNNSERRISCKKCGVNLEEAYAAARAETAVDASDQTLINNYIARMSANGWQIVSQTEGSVQIKKGKSWNKAAIILGLILLFLWGSGLLLLLLAGIDYAMKKEQTLFVTAAQLRSGTEPKPKADSGSTGTMILLGLIVLVIVLVIIF